MTVAIRTNDLAQSAFAPALERTTTASWAQRFATRLALSDLFVVLIAVFGSQLVWVHVHSFMSGDPASTNAAQPFASVYSLAVSLAWLLLLTVSGSRDRRIVGVGAMEYRRVAQASFATFGGLAIVVYLFDLQLARGYFLIALPVGLLALTLVRWSWRTWLRAKRREGDYSTRALLVGSPESVRHTVNELARMPEAGYAVLGACLPLERRHDDAGVPVVGSFETVFEALRSSGADTVIVTSSDELSAERIRRLSWQLEPGRQHLIVAPSLTDIGGPRIHTRPVAGLPLIHVETPRYEGPKLYLKRAFDVVATSLGLVLLSPVLALIALAIKLDSAGPVLFAQPRIGRNGREFKMLKFRTMVPDAEAVLERMRQNGEFDKDDGNGVLFKMRDDPRVTRIGKFLRRFSIDELPQLINVLTGDMSLVGPRPPLAREVAEYDGHVHRRFLVKPGVTGLWQVSGRSNLSWEESVRLDLYYVENWTLTGDLMLLWRTARAVLARDGAY
ncbi:sugar transferase [Salinibacterium sp. SYSU T00001]|uniref:sugar transferase n=1 Tax=Homoserinimonas sedimenticola TaxID=2986805 RepID=UPI00223688C4|nr:sugar transferase [Salinibacterium sedimenticola]MCW4384757.1 sugar transferase [Salinibacterium sedimenticola]